MFEINFARWQVFTSLRQDCDNAVKNLSRWNATSEKAQPQRIILASSYQAGWRIFWSNLKKFNSVIIDRTL